MTGDGAGDGNGRPVSAGPRPLSPASPEHEGDTTARARTLAAIHNLLRDARALRGSGSVELDPLLALAVDAIERALEKHREPVRSSYARAEISLRNARNLLDKAEAAARNVERSLADREAAATAAVAAIRTVANRMRGRNSDVPGPRRCPSCGLPYTLRFTVRGVGGNIVTTRMRCPRSRCRKLIQVQVPRTADRVRLEEATS